MVLNPTRACPKVKVLMPYYHAQNNYDLQNILIDILPFIIGFF